jgi:hypothetical protein
MSARTRTKKLFDASLQAAVALFSIMLIGIPMDSQFLTIPGKLFHHKSK